MVLPPMAACTMMAFSKASRVRILDGVRSSATIPTIRAPALFAILPSSKLEAGMRALAGRAIPRASAITTLVFAVPRKAQVPVVGHEFRARLSYSC